MAGYTEYISTSWRQVTVKLACLNKYVVIASIRKPQRDLVFCRRNGYKSWYQWQESIVL